MKPNELEIKNNIRVNYGKRTRKVYIFNRPVLCKECVESLGLPTKTKQEQYETADKGVQFLYEDGRLYCPNCNRELEIIKDYDQWKKEQERIRQEDIETVHLVFYDRSWSSGITYYRLSTRLDNEDWNKVAKYFFYARFDPDDDEQDTMYGNRLYGWLTRNPREVENALGVKEELRIDHLKKLKRDKKRKEEERVARRNELKQQIIDLFEEQGDRPVVRMQDLDGEVYEPKEYEWNIYGGGYRFIIGDEAVWFIRNNGADGDDWSRNNVETGGAGAIGWVVPYDRELELMIMEYCIL